MGSLADRLLEASWLATAATVPIYFNRLDFRIFESDKAVLLRNLCAVMAVAWLVKAAEGSRLSLRAAPARLARDPLLAAILFFTATYALSTLVSIAPRQSFGGSFVRTEGLYTTGCYVFACLAVAANMRSAAQLERLVTAIILGSVAAALYGIAQAAGLDPLHWTTDWNGRASSTAGNPIFLGAIMCMAAPLSLVRSAAAIGRVRKPGPWIAGGNRGWSVPLVAVVLVVVQFGLLAYFVGSGAHNRWWAAQPVLGAFLVLALALPALPGGRGLSALAAGGFALAFALQVAALVLSESRGPLIGLLVGCGVLGLGAVARAGSRRLGRAALVVAALAVALVLLANVSALHVGSGRAARYVGPLTRLSQTESGTGRIRLLIWRGSLDLAVHRPVAGPESDHYRWVRPLLGYGPETLAYAYGQVFQPELLVLEGRGSIPDRAHSALLDALVMNGVLGLVAYLLVFNLFFAIALERLGFVHGRRVRVLLAFTGLIGLVAYLVRAAWRGRPVPDEAGSPVAPSLLLGLVAAVSAHFTEVQFGIPVVATLTYVWLIIGATMALGSIRAASARKQPEAPKTEIPRLQLAAAAGYVLLTVAVVWPFLASSRWAPDLTLSAGFAWLLAALFVWTFSRPSGQASMPRARQGWWIAALAAVAAGALVLVNNAPIAADISFRRALDLEQHGKRAQAIPAFQSALRLAPRQDAYYLWFGTDLVQLALARPISGTSPAQQMRIQHLIHAPVREIAGLGRNGMFEAARAAFEKAQRLAPADPDHYANLARLDRFRAETAGSGETGGLLRDAELWYKRALRASPRSTSLYLELGSTYIAGRSFGAAVNALTKSIELEPSPEMTVPREARGDAYLGLHEFNAALADYRTALQRNPEALSLGDPLARVTTLVKARRIDGLIRAFRAAVRRFEGARSWSPQNQLGLIYVRLQRPSAAVIHFRAAINTLLGIQERARAAGTAKPAPNPNLWRIRRSLGIVYLQLRQLGRAREEIAAAAAIAPPEQQQGLRALLLRLEAA
ncbi:MAG: O-antigen ligase family protein [Gaiellaceae bacterium]